MSIIDLLKQKYKNPQSLFSFEKSGDKIRAMLGIEKFKYSYIQKVINYSKPVFVVSVDSKYPSLRLTPSMLNKADFSFPVIVDRKFDKFIPKSVILTPPIQLNDFKGTMPVDALILFRDFAGSYYLNELIYENNQFKLKRL